MFRLGEITEAVGGQLLSGEPRLRIIGVSIDSRTIKKGELFIAIKGERFDGHNFIREAIKKGAKAIINSFEFIPCAKRIAKSSKYSKMGFIAVSDTRRALGRLAQFHRRRFDIPIIAVTGSNGKTTVKDMLAWVLSSRLNVLNNLGTQNNDIGVPLTLLRLDISHNIVVLELGSNHFGEIAYLTNIAGANLGIITNIGPAHLEYFRTLKGVYKEKSTLLRNLKPPRIAILNADDPRLTKLNNDKRTLIITYGIKNRCNFYATEIKLTSKNTLEFFVSGYRGQASGNFYIGHCRQKIRLNTIGYANIYNALATIAVARLFGWDYKSISKRLETFIFPTGRLRLVKLRGITFIDDTYNANPVSLREALDVLSKFKVSGRRIIVMGDMLELGTRTVQFHRQAGIQIARVCDAFIGAGNLSKVIAHWAVKSGLSKDCVFSCSNSRQAGDLLNKRLRPDSRDLILVKGSRLMKMEEVLKVSEDISYGAK